jgi:hypothetical protein
MPATDDKKLEGPTETGHLLLHLSCGGSQPALYAASIRLAKAYQIPIDALFVEDDALIDAATYSFTREISYFGGRTRVITTERIRTDLQNSASIRRQQLQALAAAHQVSLKYRTTHDRSVRHLVLEASGARFLALAQAHVIAGGGYLFELVEALPELQGFLLTGAQAKHLSGPIVCIVNGREDFNALIAACQSFSKAEQRDLLLVPTNPDPALQRDLQNQMAALDLPHVHLLSPLPASPATLETLLRRSRASLLMLSTSHPLTGSSSRLATLVATICAPVLLLQQTKLT